MLEVTWTALGMITVISLGFMAMVKSEIGGLRTEMQSGLASLEGRLDRRIDKLDGKVDTMSQRIDKLDGKVDTMSRRMDKLDGKFDIMSQRIDGLR